MDYFCLFSTHFSSFILGFDILFFLLLMTLVGNFGDEWDEIKVVRCESRFEHS